MYLERFNYKLGEEVKIKNANPGMVSKILELYDDDVLVNYFTVYSDGQMSSGYNFVKTIIPYTQISKKQK